MHIAVSAEARKRANREFRAIVLRIPSFDPSRRSPRVSHHPPPYLTAISSFRSSRFQFRPWSSQNISPLCLHTHTHSTIPPPFLSLFARHSSNPLPLLYIYIYISPGVLPLFFVSTRQTTIIRRDQLFSRISPYNNYKKALDFHYPSSGFNSIRVLNVSLRLRFTRIFLSFLVFLVSFFI